MTTSELASGSGVTVHVRAADGLPRGQAVSATMTDDGPEQVDGMSAVDAAARFVALQPGGARRILLEHERRDDGTCGGCLTSPVIWPCVVSAIATKAQRLDLAP